MKCEHTHSLTHTSFRSKRRTGKNKQNKFVIIYRIERVNRKNYWFYYTLKPKQTIEQKRLFHMRPSHTAEKEMMNEKLVEEVKRKKTKFPHCSYGSKHCMFVWVRHSIRFNPYLIYTHKYYHYYYCTLLLLTAKQIYLESITFIYFIDKF